MLMLEVTYRCREYDKETGRWVEGENACRLRVAEHRAQVQPDGRVLLDQRVRGWLEDAVAAVELMQDRVLLPGSICDVRLAKKEG